MLSIKLVRENFEMLRKSLASRNVSDEPLERLVNLDKEWRIIKKKTDALKAKRNAASLLISEAKKKGEKAENLLSEMKELSAQIDKMDAEAGELETKMKEILLTLPNIPDETVPLGKNSDENVEIRKWGVPKKMKNDVKPHYEACSGRLIDFERGVKIARHRFVILRGLAAKLERALINFMLDLHVMNGYIEILPPFLVNSKTMAGTGQLPKFSEELYKCESDDLWLIPTAEVPLTNMFSDEILKEEELPMAFCAYTPCFRREAGAYQKDIKGIIRQHQFDKVELVRFCTPEDSMNQLNRLTKDAEEVLRRLELPYRVVELCTGDLGFAAAKTYDIEVWLPSQEKYREISSCSNCKDFQARRANIRFWRGGKPEFLHTLNGSGLAVGRTMVAIIENYQDENGFEIPKVLRERMGCDRIDF